MRARALMSSAGGKTSRKDYAEVLEVRSSWRASPAGSTPKDSTCGSSSGAAAFGRGEVFLVEVPPILTEDSPASILSANACTQTHALLEAKLF